LLRAKEQLRAGFQDLAELTHCVGTGVVHVREGRESLVDPVGQYVLTGVPEELAGIHLDVKVVQDPLVIAHPQLKLGLKQGRNTDSAKYARASSSYHARLDG